MCYDLYVYAKKATTTPYDFLLTQCIFMGLVKCLVVPKRLLVISQLKISNMQYSLVSVNVHILAMQCKCVETPNSHLLF